MAPMITSESTSIRQEHLAEETLPAMAKKGDYKGDVGSVYGEYPHWRILFPVLIHSSVFWRQVFGIFLRCIYAICRQLPPAAVDVYHLRYKNTEVFCAGVTCFFQGEIHQSNRLINRYCLGSFGSRGNVLEENKEKIDGGSDHFSSCITRPKGCRPSRTRKTIRSWLVVT